MGLDVSYYRDLSPIACDGEDCDHIRIYANDPAFEGREAPLTPGCYDGEEVDGFSAGSYGGYNQWRAWLSMLALGASPEDVWNNRKTFAGKPFVELVNFSDCEGTIGPDVSKKLAADFATFDEKTREGMKDYHGYYEKYQEWRKAFEVATNNGAVCFH